MKKQILAFILCLILLVSIEPLGAAASDQPELLVGASKQYDDYYGSIYVVNVPSDQFFYDFNGLVDTDLTWMVSTDLEAAHSITSKRSVIEPGDNLYFITVFEGNRTFNYTVIIRKTNESSQQESPSESSVYGVEYSRLMTVFTWGNGTNVRKEPNTNCEIVGKMNRGDTCTMLGFSEDKEWVRIIYNGDVAYIKKSLVVLPLAVWFRVNQDSIAYDGPGVNYTQVALPAGTEMEWYGITTEDDGYYVCGLKDSADSVLYLPMEYAITINPGASDKVPFNPIRLLSQFFSRITGVRD